MRVLEFDVTRQKLTKTKGCSFSHLIAGSSGYLKAKFNFSGLDNAWTGCVKAASFWKDGVEYAILLDNDNCCDIPDEVTDGRSFYISITGLRKGILDDYKIKTNKIKIIQGVG